MRTFTQRKGLWEEEAERGQEEGSELWPKHRCRRHQQLMWSRVTQLRGPLTRRGGGVPRSTDLREEELRRVDGINHEAGKCLALPHFILCVDGGSPRLEQVCTMLLLKLSQMLFSSGGQDSHPLSWPTPAAWSIFSEWIKIKHNVVYYKMC